MRRLNTDDSPELRRANIRSISSSGTTPSPNDPWLEMNSMPAITSSWTMTIWETSMNVSWRACSSLAAMARVWISACSAVRCMSSYWRWMASVVGREFLLLQEQSQHEPHERQWCEGTAEKVAEIAERQSYERAPAQRGGHIQDAGPEPKCGHHEPELDLTVAP